jgi:mRNA-degrading endonuclease HigB of HigAB toxin-antitoxin module
MKIMNRKELASFKNKHPQSIKPLTGWEITMSETDYISFSDLKRTFCSADYLSSGYTVFNNYNDQLFFQAC